MAQGVIAASVFLPMWRYASDQTAHPPSLSAGLVCEVADEVADGYLVLQSELRKPEDDPTAQNGSQADLAAGALSWLAVRLGALWQAHMPSYADSKWRCHLAETQLLQQQQLANALSALLTNGGTGMSLQMGAMKVCAAPRLTLPCTACPALPCPVPSEGPGAGLSTLSHRLNGWTLGHEPPRRLGFCS